MSRKERISKETKDFVRGYACAVSCIVAGHGSGTETDEALKAGGISTREEAERHGVDPYDIGILYPKEVVDD